MNHLARSFTPKTTGPVAAPTGVLRRKCACGQHTGGGVCAGCRTKKTNFQRAPAGATAVGGAPPIVHDVLRSPGQPLDRRTRAYMEPRFGHDFSRIRVHSDERAADSAAAVGALAYTVGNDIVFAAGRFQPESAEGRHLVAHELTHTLQQTAVAPAGSLVVDNGPSDPLEQAAEQQANAVASGEPSASPNEFASGASAPAMRTAMPSLQRAPATQPPPDSTVWQRLKSQAAMLERLYNEQRYGCWCGPGHVCEEVRDGIDACCKAHDLAYDAAGVTSGTPGPGQVGMWTPAGFIRTMSADQTLVNCTQDTAFDSHFYGPSAALYRAGVALIFESRVAIAAALYPAFLAGTLVTDDSPTSTPDDSGAPDAGAPGGLTESADTDQDAGTDGGFSFADNSNQDAGVTADSLT